MKKILYFIKILCTIIYRLFRDKHGCYDCANLGWKGGKWQGDKWIDVKEWTCCYSYFNQSLNAPFKSSTEDYPNIYDIKECPMRKERKE
jgi:hypothetical protein